MEGFFVFVNIYFYISGMKDPFENLTKKQLMELLTKTDIPQKWMTDNLIKVTKNNDRPKDSGSTK
jgi:hypothetical protein